jgi:hypothetical protein
MALKVINAAFTGKGWMAEASSTILQGMVVALEAASAGTPELARANRDGTHTAGEIAGLAYDNAYNVGNTIVLVDPVSLSFSAVMSRKINDFKDETIINQTNFTDTGTAKRGVTVMSVGGEYASDQYSSTYITASATTDVAGTPTYTVGTGWTWGSGATNAGLLISNVTYPVEGTTYAQLNMARVTDGVSGGLLFFRWVGN